MITPKSPEIALRRANEASKDTGTLPPPWPVHTYPQHSDRESNNTAALKTYSAEQYLHKLSRQEAILGQVGDGQVVPDLPISTAE